ncbi:MAG: 6-phosphofructokinase [Flavobacteriales bacterium]|nr:6-phosphofructokinase [Flavobacteriales bacterium]
MHQIKKIGILTSGGDSPGMNACIRAAVRNALFNQLEVVGILEGFNGMIHNKFKKLQARDVSNILQRGGTILRSARSKEFMTKEGRLKAFENIKSRGIDALVIIGGNGSFLGAKIFDEEFGIPYIGLPGTIDNDLYGTDYTIGFDTACNTVVDAVDKIKDTAASHNRLFFIEVMGRDSGYIALNTGIATGAEEILLPERPTDVHALIEKLSEGKKHKKNSSIVIVSEGDDGGGAIAIAAQVNKHFQQYDTRVTVLGHLQRGGVPTASDRVSASRMGHAAIEALLNHKSAIMVGILNGKISHVPIKDAIEKKKKLNPHLFEIKDALSI